MNKDIYNNRMFGILFIVFSLLYFVMAKELALTAIFMVIGIMLLCAKERVVTLDLYSFVISTYAIMKPIKRRNSHD